jgi:glycosyltransferase involved in cell wall biosynthesis
MAGLVTIVIPCFNYGHFLPETLESVVNQSYDRWECIVVDDGSTDDTEAVVRPYVRADSRFQYLYQHNRGLSAARNSGISVGRGEYFQFLDADDLIEPRKLERHVRYLEEHGDVGIVYSPVRYFTTARKQDRKYSIREPDEPWMPKTSGRGEPVLAALAKGNVMAVNCPLVRTSTITRAGRFSERLKALEDWDYWIQCAAQGARFQYLDEPETYALVRDHPDSMIRDDVRIEAAFIPFCRRALRVTSDPASRALFTQRLASARQELYVWQLRHDMTVRGALNGLILWLSLRRYRFAIQCLLGLVILPFIGRQRCASLLVDHSWTKAIRNYLSG